MAEIKYLLKFGKREHLESFVKGNLFCSNAITFWGIEDKLKIKGQGDILEAGTKIFAQKMAIQHPDTNEVIEEFGKMNGLVRFEPAEKIPVFCMFAVYEDDCNSEDDGDIKIRLSESKLQTISEHFPNADAVAIIPNPEVYIDDIRKSIGTEIMAGLVQYFCIDKGVLTKDGKTAMDMEYIKYVTQDTAPEKCDEGTRYILSTDYTFRVLFCKDIFFKKEQEYRIVLPNKIIENGKSFPVNFSTEYEIMDLDVFFRLPSFVTRKIHS